MRSDSIFIYTLNRFRNDSVPTQKTADSLAAETPAPFPPQTARRSVPRRTGRTSADSDAPDGQAPPPASAPAPPPVPAGNDTETPADSAQRNIPGETADSLAQSEPPIPDSVSMSDSVRKAKERPVDPKKLEKERLRKEKEKARTAKIKAKIKASREKAAAIAGPSRNRNGRGSAKSWPSVPQRQSHFGRYAGPAETGFAATGFRSGHAGGLPGFDRAESAVLRPCRGFGDGKSGRPIRRQSSIRRIRW